MRAVAIAAGLCAVPAGAQPTGRPIPDALWRAALAALVTLAASRSRRWPLFVMSGAAASLATGWAQVVGVASLGLAFASIWRRRADRVLDALVGGVAVQALLRLPTSWPARTSALVVAACVVAVVASALRIAPEGFRHPVRVTALALGGIALLAAGVVAVAALVSRRHVEAGIAHTREATAAARNGDMAHAGELFDAASESFADAGRLLGAWYVVPAEWVPGLGLHADALEGAVREGERVTALAASTARVADVQSIRVVDGRIDVERMRAMRDPLAAVAAELGDAGDAIEALDSPWLITPLVTRLDTLRDEVAGSRRDSAVAADAAAVLPGMLGADGPRRYLVLFTTPSETRGAGGFVGAYGEITATEGRLELTRTGSSGELNDPGHERVLRRPSDYLLQYSGYDVERWFQNATASPDFVDVADVVRQLYPQSPGGRPVDGVVLVDPFALAGILQITGPVAVDGLDEPLTADNAVDLLLREQYERFDPSPVQITAGTQARYDFLEAAARATFDALTTRTTTPSPQALVDIFGPLTRQGRVATWSSRAAEQAYLRRVQLDGGFPEAGGGDLISIVQANAGGNKMDAYLHRSVDYRVTYDPTSGTIDAVLAVRLANASPRGPLPLEVAGNHSGLPAGTNETQLTLYSPLGLLDVRLDDRRVGAGRYEQFGVRAYTVAADVPRGGAVDVVFELHGTVSPGDYELLVVSQPLAHADEFDLTLTGAGGARPRARSGVTVSGTEARAHVPEQLTDARIIVEFDG